MSKEFTNLEELFAFLQKEAQKSQSSVADKVVEMGKKSTEENFYSQYTPHSYQRTGKTEESWKKTENSDGSVTIENTRKGDDGMLISEKAATGEGWYEPDIYGWSEKRDFVTPVKEELENGKFRELMKDELNKKFKVE